MHVLVTGATGTVGQALIPALLKRGVKVTALSRRQCHVEGVKSVQGDLALLGALPEREEKYNAVVHLGANLRVCDEPRGMIDNVYATYNLARLAERAHTSRFIYASTCGVYGYAGRRAIAEDGIINPNGYYALTKYLGEKTLDGCGIPAIVLRFTYLYGPTDTGGSIRNLVSQIQTDDRIQIRQEARDYLFINDAILAIIAALRYDGSERVFNLGTGCLTPMQTIAARAAQLLGRSPDVELGPGRHNNPIDAALAQKELEWRPAADLNLTLDSTIRSFAK